MILGSYVIVIAVWKMSELDWAHGNTPLWTCLPASVRYVSKNNVIKTDVLGEASG